MPLDPRPVAVPIGRLDQSKPKDNAVVGDLIVAENLYVASGNNVTGGLELSKREGCQAFAKDVYGETGALSYRFGASGDNHVGVPTMFFPLNGTGTYVTASPGFMPPAGTAVLFTVVVTSNSFDSACVFEIYKNGVATGHLVTPGTGATGTFATSAFSLTFNGSDVLDVVLVGTHESIVGLILFTATVAFTGAAPAAVDDGLRLGTLDSALVLRTHHSVFSWLPTTQEWLDHGDGHRPAVSVDTRLIRSDGYQKFVPQRAVGAGLEMLAWDDNNGGVRYTVRDLASGMTIVDDLLLSPEGSSVRVLFSDGNFVVMYMQGLTSTTKRLKAAVIPPAAPTQSTVADLGNMTNDSNKFDAVATPENLVVYAFVERVDTTKLTRGFFDPSAGTTSSVATGYSPGADTIAGLAWMVQNPWTSAPRQYWLGVVVSGSTTKEILTVLLSNTLGFVSATAQETLAVAWAGGNIAGYHSVGELGDVKLLYDLAASPAYNGRIMLAGVRITARSVRIASRPFLMRSRWYMLTQYVSTIQPTYFLLDVTDAVARVAAKCLPDDAAAGGFGDFQAPDVETAGDVASIPLLSLEAVSTEATATAEIQGVSVAAFNFEGSDLSQPRQLSDGSLHFPGAIPLEFDGADVFESGFLLFPEKPTAAQSTVSGGLLTLLGTYTARAVYRWADSKGAIHRSSPSVPVSITLTTTNNTIDWTVAALRVTHRKVVAIDVYTTSSSDPSIYYLATSLASPLISPFDPDSPGGGADSVTFRDQIADSDLVLHEQLYTGNPLQVGELEHIAPPPCRIVATHKGRLFYGGVDTDPGAVWMSAQSIPGNGVAFNDALVFRVDGAVTAQASTDNYLEIFTADRIWIVSGTFPDATGGGSAIPEPFRLRHEVGALSSGSVVVASDGTYFKSRKGIWTLDGGLGITPVSDPIGELRQSVGDVSTIEITSGLVAPARAHVRFYTDEAKTFVWDSEWKAWTFSIGDTMSAIDAINWNGLPTHLQSDGTVRQEGPGTYFDDASAFLASRVKLAMMNLAGIRGYAELIEIQVIGRLRFPVTVTAQLYLDGSETPERPFTFDLTPGADPVLFAIRPKKRKCSSVAIEIIDSVTSGVSPGMTIEAITLLAGVHPRLARLPAVKRTTRVP